MSVFALKRLLTAVAWHLYGLRYYHCNDECPSCESLATIAEAALEWRNDLNDRTWEP